MGETLLRRKLGRMESFFLTRPLNTMEVNFSSIVIIRILMLTFQTNLFMKSAVHGLYLIFDLQITMVVNML